jgi:hypothetical protein
MTVKVYISLTSGLKEVSMTIRMALYPSDKREFSCCGKREFPVFINGCVALFYPNYGQELRLVIK